MEVNSGWGVIIPAGGLVSDPLATAIGTPRKALTLIGGIPCVTRTLAAVQAAGFNRIAVISGEDVREEIGDDHWVPEQDGQIQNARAGVEALPECEKLLFLPADTPYLSAAMIVDFVEKVEKVQTGPDSNWFAAGVCRYEDFLHVLPGFEHPHIRLREGDFMTGAFYATSRKGFLDAADIFQDLSKNRRNQFKILLRIGVVPLLRYLMHQVSIADAERTLGRFFGGSAFVITGCDPWAMADIDTVDEYRRLAREANRSETER